MHNTVAEVRRQTRQLGQLWPAGATEPISSTCAVGFTGVAIAAVSTGPTDIGHPAIAAATTVATATIAGGSTRTAGATSAAGTTDPCLSNSGDTVPTVAAVAADRAVAPSTTGTARTADPDRTR